MMFNTEIKGCKTKDNVTVLIDVSVVLRVMGDNPEERPGDDPQNVYKFVHEVTPVGLQAQLKDAQAEAVRTLARSVYHTEVFGLRNVCHSELEGVQEKLFSTEVTSEKTNEQEQKDTEGEHDYYDSLVANFNVAAGASVTEAMRVRLNRQFNEQGIEILDVIIKDIKLPETIQSQMSQKTMVISQNAMQRIQQKHDMLGLIQEEEIKTLNQTHSEKRKELLEDGKFECIMEDIKLQTVHAEGDRQIKSIETQMSIDVELVQVESNLTVQRMRDETKLETERIREQSVADSEIELAKARAEVDMILANGELDVAKIAAKGDKGKAIPSLMNSPFLTLVS
jgi:regulator of protease activity HflC (stomatin/prohibitin superfamily)